MPTYEFEVHQVPVAPHQHSYEFEDKLNGKRLPLPRGGNDDGTTNLVGAYPEIEDYLLTEYGVKTNVVFISSLDGMNYRPGGATWTYNRAGGLVVIVHDINRVVFSMTITFPPHPPISGNP